MLLFFNYLFEAKKQRVEIIRGRSYYVKKRLLRFEGELALWESALAAQLLGGLERLLVLGESATDRSGLAVSQVLWDVLLALIELPQVLLLGLVDHGENASNRLANHSARINISYIS